MEDKAQDMQNNDNQTDKNSIINRGETNRKDLENEIRSTWLGIRFEERELYNKELNGARIEQVRGLWG